MNADKPIISFLSFDVEALPGRSDVTPFERLVWGELNGEEYGIRRLSRVLSEHGIKGNFLIDFGMCLLYGDKPVKKAIDFLLQAGHEVHAHLHSEWIVRHWDIKGDFKGPLQLDRTDAGLSDSLMQFTAWKYRQLTGSEPGVFRSGSYLFSEHTVRAAMRAGFAALSNYNSDRHDNIRLPAAAANDCPFLWDNRLLELPVDYSPEPLSYDWTKYVGRFERAHTRKQEKTFNLVLHSWSLLKRNGDLHDEFAPDYEDRLHQICEHLTQNTRPMGYRDFIAEHDSAISPRPCVDAAHSSLPTLALSSQLVATCTICGYGFTAKPEADTCPGCGSRARHRQVKDALSRVPSPFDGKLVLANYANTVERLAFLGRVRTLLNFDVRPVSEVELQMDVQKMSVVRDRTIDTFFALHVLNHVTDDEQALREIARVLKPGGVAVLTVPYDENASSMTGSKLTEHYGQENLEKYGVGTYRRYGLDDVKRLFAEYFEVESEVGLDPVTTATMHVFFLRKRD